MVLKVQGRGLLSLRVDGEKANFRTSLKRVLLAF